MSPKEEITKSSKDVMFRSKIRSFTWRPRESFLRCQKRNFIGSCHKTTTNTQR